MRTALNFFLLISYFLEFYKKKFEFLWELFLRPPLEVKGLNWSKAKEAEKHLFIHLRM